MYKLIMLRRISKRNNAFVVSSPSFSFFLSLPSFCCPFFCLGVFQLLLYIRLVTNLWVSCRFLFCQAVLMLYAPTFKKKEFHPMCMPPLPSSVLPTAINSQIAVMQIANIFGAVNSFIFSEGVKLPENRHGDDMDVISSYWKHVSGAEWAWICKNMYLFRWVSNIFTKMFVVPWVSGSLRDILAQILSIWVVNLAICVKLGDVYIFRNFEQNLKEKRRCFRI